MQEIQGMRQTEDNFKPRLAIQTTQLYQTARELTTDTLETTLVSQRPRSP